MTYLVSYLMSYIIYQSYSVYVSYVRFLARDTLSFLAVAVACESFTYRKAYYTGREAVFLNSYQNLSINVVFRIG